MAFDFRDHHISLDQSVLNLFERLPWNFIVWISLQLDLFDFDQRLFWILFRIIIVHLGVGNPVNQLFAPMPSALWVSWICWPRLITVHVLKTQKGWCPFVLLRWVLIGDKFFYVSFVLPLDFEHLMHHFRVSLLSHFTSLLELWGSCFAHSGRSLLRLVLLRPLSEQFDKFIDFIGASVIVFYFHVFVLRILLWIILKRELASLLQ